MLAHLAAFIFFAKNQIEFSAKKKVSLDIEISIPSRTGSAKIRFVPFRIPPDPIESYWSTESR